MANSDVAGRKDLWDILKIVAVALSAVAIPVILAVVGNRLNVSLKDKDVRLRTVELAIGILREDPKNPNRETKALRLWAMDVVEQLFWRSSFARCAERATEGTDRAPRNLSLLLSGW